MILGPFLGVCRILQQEEFALDTQRIRDAPELAVASRAFDRFIDCRQALGYFPGAPQAFRQVAEKRRRVRQTKPCYPKLGKRDPKMVRSRGNLVALDQQHSFETTAPNLPKGQRMSFRMSDQHANEMFGGRQVAIEKRDPARRVGKRVAERRRMINCLGIIDGFLGSAKSLIWESLQPEDLPQRGPCHYSLVELEADEV